MLTSPSFALALYCRATQTTGYIDMFWSAVKKNCDTHYEHLEVVPPQPTLCELDRVLNLLSRRATNQNS